MPEWNCCDNPLIEYSREENTSDGGKQKLYICLSCGHNHFVTFSKEGYEIDHIDLP
jgi:RNase P subunit RPR2